MEFSKCEGTCKNKRKQIVKTEFLKLYPKYYFKVLRTPKLRQYFIDTTQVTTLALWCKIMQHSSGGKVQ